MSILAIDPGNIESAFVVVTDDLSKVIDKGGAGRVHLVCSNKTVVPR